MHLPGAPYLCRKEEDLQLGVTHGASFSFPMLEVALWGLVLLGKLSDFLARGFICVVLR